MYFFYGEEFFYINKFSDFIQTEVLEEEDKIFNQFILYAYEIDHRDVITLCKEFPIGKAKRKLIILKEAQHYSDTVWKDFEKYFDHVQLTTILVIEYKYKTFDKKTNIYRILNKNQWIYESKKLYNNQLIDWILYECKNNNLKINQKSILLLIQYLGNDLSKIYNELKKIILFDIKEITVDVIKNKLSINRTYSIFDFNKSLGSRNLLESINIMNFFFKYEKEFPIIKINYQIFYFFSQLMLIHTLNNKSKSFIAHELKINIFFVDFFVNCTLNYKIEEIIKIINIIYQYDLKFKGINVPINVNYQELFKEMIYKILFFKL